MRTRLPRLLLCVLTALPLSACSDDDTSGDTGTTPTPGGGDVVLGGGDTAQPPAGTDTATSGGLDTATSGGACTPQAKRCSGAVAEVCDASGAWAVASDCGAQNMTCNLGNCVGACARDPKLRTNAGCEYWAVDLDNSGEAVSAPFAVIVSNLGTIPATVTVTRRDNASAPPAEVMRRDVAPGSLEILSLPTRNMLATGLHWAGYKITSTAPVIAYQFNPLENVGVYSNDASLLLPADTFGTEFIVLSHEEVPAQPPTRGFFSVVAAGAATEVTITATGETQAGGGLPSLSWGERHTVTLEPYQVLNVRSNGMGSDLTGTVITANRPVGVFAGHEGALSAPLTEARDRYLCCFDHLEHQLYPVATWGTTYLATRAQARGRAPDYWRIVASEDGTRVTFDPSSAHSPVSLGRGEWVDFPSTADFIINADKPVMVGQILASSGEITEVAYKAPCFDESGCDASQSCEMGRLRNGQEELMCLPPTCSTAGSTAGCPAAHVCVCDPADPGCRCQPLGDPTLIMVPPASQYRDSYVFLTPNKYAFDYVNIVAPSDASVRLDDRDVGPEYFTAVGGQWKVARLLVQDGVHRLNASKPVGVVVYGYDDDVSYGYAGGLNLVDR